MAVKRSQLARKTTLKRGGNLKRSEWKPRRHKADVSTNVRKQVKQRSGGRCELKVPNVCTGWGQEIDHVKNRSQLGGHDLENLRHACRPCHRWKTENPNAAHELGIYRRGWE